MKIYKYSELKTTDYWRTWQDSLAKKHGTKGEMGERGENFAREHIEMCEYFADTKLVVQHDDPYHQMLGIDFTLIRDVGVQFVDIKIGPSFLYWDYNKREWFITIRASTLNTKKATTHFMFLSPRGDKWAFIPRATLEEMIKLIPTKASKIYWTEWPMTIATNIKTRNEVT